MSQRGQIKTAIVGAYFRDLIFYSDAFPAPGQTVKAQFESGHGGKGSNQAICAHKLGLRDLRFVSAVGGDAFGQEVAGFYRDAGIRAHFCSSAAPTGCAGIFVQQSDGQNVIQIAEGAMADLRLEAARPFLEAECADARLFVFQCEMPYENELEIMRFVRWMAPRAVILLNPAPFRADYDYRALLPLVDILVPNETELRGLLPAFDAASAEGQLEALRSLGVPHLLVTLGAAGCFYCGAAEHFRVRPLAVSPTDTTGAGDCFIGAFCAYFDGANFREAAEMGCIAAGLSTERRGTSKSCPTPQEVAEARGRY